MIGTCIYSQIFSDCKVIVMKKGDEKKVVCPNCNKHMRGRTYRTARVAAMYLANNACEKCGKKENLDCHHMKPICWGGTNEVCNLMILCKEHHIDAHFYIGLPIR